MKVVETLNTEHVVDELPPEDVPHEAFAVTCVRRNRSLGEVLNSNQSQPPREVHAVGTLSHNKRLVVQPDRDWSPTVDHLHGSPSSCPSGDLVPGEERLRKRGLQIW